MTSPAAPPRPDRGTGLGRIARALTRVLSAILSAGRAVPRALRWLAAPFSALGRAFAALRAWGGRVVKDLERRFEATGAWARAHARVLWVIAGVVAVITFAVVGVTVPGAATAGGSVALRLVGFVVVFIVVAGVIVGISAGGKWLAVVLREPFSRLGQAASSVGRTIARGVRAAAGAVGRAFAIVGRAIGRVLSAVGRAIGAVVSRIAAVIARGARPIGRVLARAWASTIAVVARAAWPVRRVVASAGTWVVAAAEHVGWRIAHTVGVAVVKARVEHRTVDDAGMLAAARARAIDRVTMPSGVCFDTTVDQNEYLFHGGTEVHAIVTIDAHGDPDEADPETATVIMLDCSGSMGLPWAKLRRAREATGASIDALRDDSWFAIVRATDSAEVLYPPDGALVPATDDTRRAARESLRLLWPEGGTAMGRWLRLARALVDERPGAIAHAILLTDGRDESETPAELDAALRECTGRLQCDCRGIGTDWEVEELRTIATRTVGTVDIVADARDLEADFRSMTTAAMAKQVGDVRLRIWTPRGATLRFVQQVSPSVVDLTPLRRRVGERTVEVPTGAWGTESREYHVCIDVPARAVGEEMLAARVTLEVGAVTAGQSLVRAVWTSDEERATRISRRVAHATGQVELVDHVRAGLAARRVGDDATATDRLGRAVALATATGNEGTLRLLRTVVDVDDAAIGSVRLRADADLADEMALDARSTRTTRLGASDSQPVSA